MIKVLRTRSFILTLISNVSTSKSIRTCFRLVQQEKQIEYIFSVHAVRQHKMYSAFLLSMEFVAWRYPCGENRKEIKKRSKYEERCPKPPSVKYLTTSLLSIIFQKVTFLEEFVPKNPLSKDVFDFPGLRIGFQAALIQSLAIGVLRTPSHI